jgi:hypothetical protein
MCFSAQASFTAAVVIGVIGVVTLFRVRAKNYLLFATIPLIFALQQAIEGIIWLTLSTQPLAWLQTLAIYLFLFFAALFWPIWVPASMYVIEGNPKRKKWIKGLFLIGLLYSLFSLWNLLQAPPVAHAIHHHIQYPFVDDAFKLKNMTIDIPSLVAYFLSTVAVIMISSVRWMWLYGFLILIFQIISIVSYAKVEASVWCFFAAISSMLIYFIVAKNQSYTNEPAKTVI